MRFLRLMIVVVLSTAAAPSVAILLPQPAIAADATNATLSVTPTHGTWNAPISISYHGSAWVPGLGYICRDRYVTFRIDGLVIGTAPIVQNGQWCDAHAQLVLSQMWASQPGPHTIATQPGGDEPEVGAAYTIDPSPSPTAKAAPTRSPQASRTTAGPSPGAASASADTGVTSPTPTASPSAASTSDAPRAVAQASVATLTSSGDTTSSSTPTSWVLVSVSAMIIGGLGLVALLIFQRRRTRTDPSAHGPGNDVAEPGAGS